MVKITRCPYKYKTALKISKTLGFFGTDRLYIGKSYSGTFKLILALFSLMMAPLTLGTSIILPCFIWMYDVFSIYTKSLVPNNCYKDKKLKAKGWRYYIDEIELHSKMLNVILRNKKEKLENKYSKENTNMKIASAIIIVVIFALVFIAYKMKSQLN